MPATEDAPGPRTAHHANHAPRGIQKDQVERKTHEARMHRRARRQPQARPGRQRHAPHQPQRPAQEAARRADFRDQHPPVRSAEPDRASGLVLSVPPHRDLPPIGFCAAAPAFDNRHPSGFLTSARMRSYGAAMEFRPPKTWMPPGVASRLQTAVADAQAFPLRCPPASAPALLAWELAALVDPTAVWVLDGPRTLDRFVEDLEALEPERAARRCVFPARDMRPGAAGRTETDAGLEGERLAALRCLQTPPAPKIVATCIQALLQPTLAPDRLRRHTRTLEPGTALDLEALALDLEAAGYASGPEVQRRGEFARRGGILDVWPPAEPWPVRLEFLGPAIESLRAFDPVEQRSIARQSRLEITPAGESFRDAGEGRLSDHLPAGAFWIWMDPARIEAHASIFERTAAESGGADPDAAGALHRRIAEAGTTQIRLVPEDEDPDAEALPWQALDPIPRLDDGQGLEPEAIDRLRRRFVDELIARSRTGRPVRLFFRTPGARDRFVESFGADGFPAAFDIRTGRLAEGFTVGDGELTVVAERDLYVTARTAARGAAGGSPRARPPRQGPRIAEWTDIQPGELVVHVQHGIGRYLGLLEIKVAGATQEVLAVEYAGGARLYVPADQAHLLSRYVGVGRRRPELHRLGGTRWGKEKHAAERAVRDLAAGLLETQALRQTQQGIAHPADTPWQHEFEAGFPYEETPDQHEAIDAVKRDMEAPRPMDRLICGDVGYGKTEVAMRAALKAVLGGRQVAVLVPTTVLAQQHFDTFRERMAAFPVAIEMLSRFRTRREQQAAIKGLREGRVDIVIGTHRLVQGDVQFRDLGLVVIDEEQRFGVAHKEALKEFRRLVDVLTLTATPIPRTLYLGLMGARDLSVIQTAPRERLPIETIVAPWDEHTIREAILRELNREGQVYYLYNRVLDIDAMHLRLARLVPEARIRVAHGQMQERELERIMHRFVAGDFDVLLCTTIIESGLDIPNVNTILIDRADRFGVADLYQLRGRVGRYRRQAYAFLLLPRHGRLFDTARRRIQALRRHGGLGGGLRIALQDLQIRGAGNVLGSAQSGHIAAVGFDLYCQLLRRTVARLQGRRPPPVIEVQVRLDFLDFAPGPEEKPDSAMIPYGYVEDENHRLALYRTLAAAATGAQVRALRGELKDRFGPIPPAVDRLLRIARLRVLAHRKGIAAIETRDDRLLIRRGRDWLAPGGRLPRLAQAGPTARLDEILAAVAELPTARRTARARPGETGPI